MPEIIGSIEILRPVEEVWAYLSDLKNNVQWENGVIEMELTTEGPVSVGSKYRRVEKMMGTDEGVLEITELVQNESLSFEFESPRFVGRGGYQMEVAAGGTRLNYLFNGGPKPLFFKILIPLMMPMFRRQIRKDYERVKGILES